MNRAVFLDKDGVIIEETGFVHRIEDFKLIPRSLEALQKLSETDFRIIVVSNASAVGRGMCTEAAFREFHDAYTSLLRDKGVRIDDAFYCFHHPASGIGEYKTECNCRKPLPGMLLKGIERFDINPIASYMVGDKRSDIAAGREAGCTTILVETGYGGKGGSGCKTKPDFVVPDLYAAVEQMLATPSITS